MLGTSRLPCVLIIHLLLKGIDSEITINGDLMLGFIAPIRRSNGSNPIGHVTQDGLNLAEVAMFVMEVANQEIMFETGVKLGLEILDSHQGISKISTRLFMPFAPHTQCSAVGRTLMAPKTDNRVIGVLGFENHREIEDFSLFAEHYEIPVISYDAPSPTLDEKLKYPFLLRSVPSDTHMYRTMADQILHTGLEGIGVIAEDTIYGNKSREIFGDRLQQTRQRLEQTEMIACPPRKEDIFEAIKRLTADSKIKIVAFVVSEHHAKAVIEALNELPSKEMPRIIAPHPFSEYLNVSQAIRFRDMIVVRHVTKRLPNFGDYYLLLCQHGGKTPWWPDYWHGLDKQICLHSVPESPKFNFIANGVYAFAHSLKRFMKDNCVGIDKHACVQFLLECRGRHMLMDFLQNSDFQALGSTSQEPRFTFDLSRDALPQYEVVQLKVRSLLGLGLLRWGELVTGI